MDRASAGSLLKAYSEGRIPKEDKELEELKAFEYSLFIKKLFHLGFGLTLVPVLGWRLIKKFVTNTDKRMLYFAASGVFYLGVLNPQQSAKHTELLKRLSMRYERELQEMNKDTQEGQGRAAKPQQTAGIRAPEGNYRPLESSYRPPESSFRPSESSYHSESSFRPPEHSYRPPEPSYRPPESSYRSPEPNYHLPGSSHRPPAEDYYNSSQPSSALPTSPYLVPGSSSPSYFYGSLSKDESARRQ